MMNYIASFALWTRQAWDTRWWAASPYRCSRARGRFRIQRFLRTEGEDVVLVDALRASEATEVAMLDRRLALDDAENEEP